MPNWETCSKSHALSFYLWVQNCFGPSQNFVSWTKTFEHGPFLIIWANQKIFWTYRIKARATVGDIKKYYTSCAHDWAGWNVTTEILLPNGADCSHTNPGILTAGSSGGLNLGDRGHHQGIVRVLVLRSVPCYSESIQYLNFGLGIRI